MLTNGLTPAYRIIALLCPITFVTLQISGCSGATRVISPLGRSIASDPSGVAQEVLPLLERYLKAYQDFSAVKGTTSEVSRAPDEGEKIRITTLLAEKGNAQAALLTRIFVSPGSLDYLECLQTIERKLASKKEWAEAYYELAKALQYRWEKDFGKALLEKRVKRERAIDISANIGWFFVAAPLMRKFMTYKGTLESSAKGLRAVMLSTFKSQNGSFAFAALSGLGAKAAARGLQGTIDGDVPISPLLILEVGLPESEGGLEPLSKMAIKELTALGLTFGAMKLLDKGWKVVKTGGSVALSETGIGTVLWIAASLAIEHAVTKGYDELDYQKLKFELKDSLVRLEDHLKRSDDLLLYQEADRFVDLALALSRKIGEPAVKLAESYNAQLVEISQKFGENSDVFKGRSRILLDDYLIQLETLKKRKSVSVVNQLIEAGSALIEKSGKAYLHSQKDLLASIKFRDEMFLPKSDNEAPAVEKRLTIDELSLGRQR